MASVSIPSNASAPPAPPSPPKPKRARVSTAKRKRAAALEQKLKFLLDNVGDAELGEILETAIAATHRLSEASRSGDYDLVLKMLELWERAEMADILEETGLSRWVADAVLRRLEANGLIRTLILKPPIGEGGRPRYIIELIHKLPPPISKAKNQGPR